jgi:hypothetical protein
VLDAKGIILAVNAPWRAFGAARSGFGFGSAEEATTISRCSIARARTAIPSRRRARRRPARSSRAPLASPSIEYRLGTAPATRCYLARVTPLDGTEHGAVVSHTDVTDQMMAHAALETAHARLQNLSKRVLSIQEEEPPHDRAGSLHGRHRAERWPRSRSACIRLIEEPAADRDKLQQQCLAAADETLDPACARWCFEPAPSAARPARARGGDRLGSRIDSAIPRDCRSSRTSRTSKAGDSRL